MYILPLQQSSINEIDLAVWEHYVYASSLQNAFKNMTHIWHKGCVKRTTFIIVLVFLKSSICTWSEQHGKRVGHVDRVQHQQTFFFVLLL